MPVPQLIDFTSIATLKLAVLRSFSSKTTLPFIRSKTPLGSLLVNFKE